MRVLTTANGSEWERYLARASTFDFYHLPAYHRLAEHNGDGRALFVVYEEGGSFIGLPLLLRVVSMAPGTDAPMDATSVYGYAGPVSSSREATERLAGGFQIALASQMRAEGVIAVFSRLHPLINQEVVLRGLGELVPLGQTVSIDLTIAPHLQRAGFRKNHKEGINRLRRRGYWCAQDLSGERLDSFLECYNETMARVGADEGYLFSRDYLGELLTGLRKYMHLWVCGNGDEVACAGIFSSCGELIEYHLGGTRTRFLSDSPMKLLFDEVRLWANGEGATAFHLGGGVGSREDSLFHFKAGFSDRRHGFTVWRWIVDEERYASLCEALRPRDQRLDAPESDHYFPLYRSPEWQR